MDSSNKMIMLHLFLLSLLPRILCSKRTSHCPLGLFDDLVLQFHGLRSVAGTRQFHALLSIWIATIGARRVVGVVVSFHDSLTCSVSLDYAIIRSFLLGYWQ